MNRVAPNGGTSGVSKTNSNKEEGRHCRCFRRRVVVVAAVFALGEANDGKVPSFA